MLKKIAFGLGVAVGLFNLVSTATVILTYYFTGRVPSMMVERAEAGRRRPHIALLTPDDVVDQAREQMRRRFGGEVKL